MIKKGASNIDQNTKHQSNTNESKIKNKEFKIFKI